MRCQSLMSVSGVVKGIGEKRQLSTLRFGFYGKPAPPISYRQSSLYIDEEVSLTDRNT